MPSDREPDDKADTDRRPTAAEIRYHRRTVPGGTPIVPSDDDPDPGWEWPDEPDRQDAEVLRRAGRDPEDAVRPAEVSAIVRRLLREFQARLSAQGSADLRDDVVALQRQVSDHSQVIGPARTAASWALRGTVAAVLVVGGFLYKRGSDEQRIVDQIQVLADKVQRLETQVEKIKESK